MGVLYIGKLINHRSKPEHIIIHIYDEYLEGIFTKNAHQALTVGNSMSDTGMTGAGILRQPHVVYTTDDVFLAGFGIG